MAADAFCPHSVPYPVLSTAVFTIVSTNTSDTLGQLGASKPVQLHNFSRYFPSLVVCLVVADLEVSFELCYCETFPFLGLLQERPALKGTEGRSLTVQRSYRAVSAYILQDGSLFIPVNPLLPCSSRTCVKTIFDSLAGHSRKLEWFANCCFGRRQLDIGQPDIMGPTVA